MHDRANEKDRRLFPRIVPLPRSNSGWDLSKLRSDLLLCVAFALAGFFSMGQASGQELRLDVSTRMRYDNDAGGNSLAALPYANLAITDLIKNRVDVKISGWGIWDISNNDAFNDALERRSVRISEAYVDIRNLGVVSRVRIGRQNLYDVDYLHFDGVTLRFMEDKPLSFFAFGGKEVDFYQSTYDDWVLGGGMIWKPSWKTKHQVDLYVLSEGSGFWIASGWRWNQYWGKGWRTTSRLRGLDTEFRDYRLTLSKYFEKVGLGLDADYFIQPRTRGIGDEASTRTISDFARILGSRQPYQRFGVNLSKYFGESWLLQLGGSVRYRLDHEDEDNFNSMNSSSAHLSLTRFNAFFKNVDVTVGGEYIDNENQSFVSATGEVSYRPTKQWSFSAGYSFSHFQLDPFNYDTNYYYGHFNAHDFFDEHNYVRRGDYDVLIQDVKIPAYFFEARWKPNNSFDVRADITWENTHDIDGIGLSARIGVNYHLKQSFGAKEEAEKKAEGTAKAEAKEAVSPNKDAGEKEKP